MTDERLNELWKTGGELTPAEISKGWHYCPDWDFMIINPDCSEAEACLCNLEAYKAKHGTGGIDLKSSLNKYINKDQ